MATIHKKGTMRVFLPLQMIVIVVLGLLAPTGQAGAILGFTGSIGGQPQTTAQLVDIDTTTGNESNPRDTGIYALGGIASQPGTGLLFGVTTFASNPLSSLVQINRQTGQATLVGAIGIPNVIEGDLAFNPANNLLYGLQSGGPSFPLVERNLFTINTTTGAGSIIGSLSSSGDYSAMMFDAGFLWVIDAQPGGNTNALAVLSKVDPNTATIISSVTMSSHLGNALGMARDPITGDVIVGDGGNGSPNNLLYTLNLNNGVLITIGALSIPGGIGGLDSTPIPEPSGLGLLGTVLLTAALRRRINANRCAKLQSQFACNQ